MFKFLKSLFTCQEPRPRDVLNGGSIKVTENTEASDIVVGSAVICINDHDSRFLKNGCEYVVENIEYGTHFTLHPTMKDVYGNITTYEGGNSTYLPARFKKA